MEMSYSNSNYKQKSKYKALLRSSPFKKKARQNLDSAIVSSNLSSDDGMFVAGSSHAPTSTIHGNAMVQSTVATAIPIYCDGNFSPSLATATPVVYASIDEKENSPLEVKQLSDYCESLVKPVRDDRTCNAFSDEDDFPKHESKSPRTQQDISASLLRQAQVRGEVEREKENESIMRSREEADIVRHNAVSSLRVANVIAAIKSECYDEGLTVDEVVHSNYLNKYTHRGEENVVENDVKLYGTIRPDGKRGYEVTEYDTTEYKTEEYDVTEYTSVYE